MLLDGVQSLLPDLEGFDCSRTYILESLLLSTVELGNDSSPAGLQSSSNVLFLGRTDVDTEGELSPN